MNEINGYWLKIPIEIIWNMRQKNERNIDLIYSSRTQDRILDHRILRFEVLTCRVMDFLLMSHDIQWKHPRSSMSKVSCLKMHNDRKEISSSFVTEEKVIFNQRPKKKPYPSDQVKRQIKYQCWHVNKHTRPWGGLFISPWGIYEAAAFLIPVSSASHVCRNYYTIIYGLAYCIQTQQTILELKETES